MEGTPAYVYSQSVNNILATPHLLGSVAGAEIVAQIGKFPVTLGGWNLQSIECLDIECKAKWVSDGGTYSDFKDKAYADWSKLDFSSGARDALGDLKVIKHDFKMKLSKSNLPPRSAWPSTDSYTFDTGVEWQALKSSGWSAALKTVEQQAIPASINAVSVRLHPDAVYAMPWDSQNVDWWTARQVIAKLTPSVEIKTFELHVDSKTNTLKFGISGLAYVNK